MCRLVHWDSDATGAPGIAAVLKSPKDISFSHLMKRIAAFMLLLALSLVCVIPAGAQNARTKQNARMAKKAAKQNQKAVKKAAKKQRKAAKKSQRASRRAAKRSQRR